VLVDHPLEVLVVVGIIVIGKSFAAAAIVLLFRYPLNTALTVSASLAQIGEFSFILAALGVSLGLLPPLGQSLIVAGALISIALNPLVFRAIEPVQRWARSRSTLAQTFEGADDPLAALPDATDRKFLSKQVVLVGHGRVGSDIAEALRTQHIPFVVVEQNRELVSDLRERGTPAVSGNAAEPGVLIQAHIAHAAMLVIATPETLEVRAMAETAKTLNPGIQIVIRTHNPQEAALLEKDECGKVFFGEQELARAMTRYVLERLDGRETG
jgi:CPA2 family monovalent cation:H+ antiporter-2